MTTPLTKDAEIAHYRTFVAALPDGYLRDILRGTEDYVADLIRQDFCFPAIHLQQAERMSLQAELKALHVDKARMEGELRTKRRELERLQEALADLRSTARKLAGV
jgi:hypothetical protein